MSFAVVLFFAFQIFLSSNAYANHYNTAGWANRILQSGDEKYHFHKNIERSDEDGGDYISSTKYYVDTGGDTPIQFNVSGVSCKGGDMGISSNIIRCLDSVIELLSRKYIVAVTAQLTPWVTGLATLAIMFFGIQAAFYGISSIRGQTSVLIFKLLVVLFVAQSADLLIEYRGYLVSFARTIGNILSEGMMDALDTADLGTMDALGIDHSGANVFEALDITIGYMLGGGSLILVAAIVIGFFTGYYQLAVYVLGILVTLVMFLVQSIVIYITSMISITVLTGFAPVVVPFILFERTKKMVFDWFHQLIVYSVIPLVLIIFISMSISVFATIGDLSKDTLDSITQTSRPLDFFKNDFLGELWAKAEAIAKAIEFAVGFVGEYLSRYVNPDPLTFNPFGFFADIPNGFIEMWNDAEFEPIRQLFADVAAFIGKVWDLWYGKVIAAIDKLSATISEVLLQPWRWGEILGDIAGIIAAVVTGFLDAISFVIGEILGFAANIAMSALDALIPDIMVPDMGFDDLAALIGLVLAMLITVLSLYGFLEKLPGIADELVARSVLGKMPQFAQDVERVGGAIKAAGSAAGGAAGGGEAGGGNMDDMIKKAAGNMDEKKKRK